MYHCKIKIYSLLKINYIIPFALIYINKNRMKSIEISIPLTTNSGAYHSSGCQKFLLFLVSFAVINSILLPDVACFSSSSITTVISDSELSGNSSAWNKNRKSPTLVQAQVGLSTLHLFHCKFCPLYFIILHNII